MTAKRAIMKSACNLQRAIMCTECKQCRQLCMCLYTYTWSIYIYTHSTGDRQEILTDSTMKLADKSVCPDPPASISLTRELIRKATEDKEIQQWEAVDFGRPESRTTKAQRPVAAKQHSTMGMLGRRKAASPKEERIHVELSHKSHTSEIQCWTSPSGLWGWKVAGSILMIYVSLACDVP